MADVRSTPLDASVTEMYATKLDIADAIRIYQNIYYYRSVSDSGRGSGTGIGHVIIDSGSDGL